MYDVIQVGYGPVSQSLALMLGQQGRSVLVCERWENRYPLPRAVCVDHELYRVLSANGMTEALPEVTERGPLYQWFNAEWRELLAIDWSADSISGGAEVNFVHQPTLEEALDAAVSQQGSVELRLGWEAISVAQDESRAIIKLRHCKTGEIREESAQFVVGCDGANSLVRETIGGQREDRGFQADWLVIDVLLKPGVTIETLGIPAAGQYCNPTRPTTIVPAGVRDGRTFRRWEFMRLPGESIQDLEREDRVWELLKPWAGPNDIELVRHKVYNFRSLLAAKWRDGRLLIAGDAAHVMPPFMGQGMCSGLRDAWNLAWKLALVLDRRADSKLLDAYQVERMPHVSQIIDMSIYLGKIICIPDQAAAAERDRAFLTGAAEPMPPFPALTQGLLKRDDNGAVEPGAGSLSPHVEVETHAFTGRLDHFTGPGFVVFTTGYPAQSLLPAALLAGLNAIGVRHVELGASGARDLDGRLAAFLTAHGWDAMIVRPDFYVYGGADGPEALEKLAAALLEDLRSAGVVLPEVAVEEAD